MTLDPRVTDKDRRELVRSRDGETVSLGPGVSLQEFVGKACGAMGFSTGMAAFDIGAVLPYHKHPFTEAVAILDGARPPKRLRAVVTS
jgi:hypothetical protein